MDLAQKRLVKKATKITIGLIITMLLLALIVLSVSKIAGLTFFTISGRSMEPTLTNHSSVLLKREDKLANNMIVFFNRPEAWNYAKDFVEGEPELLVKRATAVAGDKLTFDGESFKVNGELVFSTTDGSYSCTEGNASYSHTLSQNELFVTGDNANHSLDSRRVFCDGKPNFYVPRDSVLKYGKIVFSL